MISDGSVKVLFVCTGNICRSPLAEALFRQMVKDEGLEEHFQIESAGTSTYHVGERPHRGTQDVLKKNRVPIDPEKRAQAIQPGALNQYDYVVAMDRANVQNLRRWGKVPRLLEYAEKANVLDVPDPYYEDNFDEVYELVENGLRGLLSHIRQQEGI